MSDDTSQPAAGLEVLDGAWAGWLVDRLDPYEQNVGPFYKRQDEHGNRQSAFRVEKRHLNNSGFVHGGCLMSFADFSLFWIAHEFTSVSPAVTASFNSEFISSAKQSDLLQSQGEVVRAASSLIFVRGLITNLGKPVLTFSANNKKINRTPRAEIGADT
jgi:acyl-coenzyme A thioesterase PaaI-like protein